MHLRKRAHGPNVPMTTTERVVLSTGAMEIRRSTHCSWTHGLGSLGCFTRVRRFPERKLQGSDLSGFSNRSAMIICTSERECAEQIIRMFQRPQQSVLSCRLARWKPAEAHIAPGLTVLVLWAVLFGYVVVRAQAKVCEKIICSRTDPP